MDRRRHSSSHSVPFKRKLKGVAGGPYFGMLGAHLLKPGSVGLISKPQHIAFNYAT
jgi:hypothetical protein